MQDVTPFVALMKEVSFIFDIHIPKPEVFCKVFEYNKSCIFIAEFFKNIRLKNILLLSIIISEDFCKRKLFGCVALIQENKQRIFLQSHSTKHYLCIYEENYPDGEVLK